MASVGFVYLLVAGASAAVGAYSSIQQGKAAKQQAAYNAAVIRNNQKQATAQVDFDIQRTREKYRRLRGAQQSAAATSGISTDGSYTAINLDTALTEDLDVLTQLYKAKTLIVNEEGRRNLTFMQADQASQQAKLEAGGKILSAAGSAIATYPTLN